MQGFTPTRKQELADEAEEKIAILEKKLTKLQQENPIETPDSMTEEQALQFNMMMVRSEEE